MMRPQNLMEHQLSSIVLPESDDRFDQELVGWFTRHGGVWSGTATELLSAVRAKVSVGNDLWPQSPRALYAHMESHTQVLRSLGVDVLLPHGCPRIVSLRSCQDEKSARELPLGASGINLTSDPPRKLTLLANDQKTSPATTSSDVSPAASETFSQKIPTAKSGLAKRFVNGQYADGDNFEGGVFENTAEALFAIVEMGGRIRKQGLDRKSAIDLVVRRSQEITRCSGVAVGLLQHDSVVYPARAGVAAAMAGLHFQANLFQSCLRTGEAILLRDAQKDTLVGPTCRREGIRSLIIVPIFLNREVAGAMELLFKETCSFSAGDLMTLELIADVIGEGLSGAAQIELKQAEAHECPAKPKPVENIEPQLGHSLNEKAGQDDALPSPSQDTIDPETSLRLNGFDSFLRSWACSLKASSQFLQHLPHWVKRNWLKASLSK